VSGIPAKALLSRRAGGVEQKKLDAKERAKNVNSRFEVIALAADEIKGKRIILVDDIVTTGASMAECTRTLIRAGALSVIALSVATTYKE
jgi:predicted amidophosphoribosyltransferase